MGVGTKTVKRKVPYAECDACGLMRCDVQRYERSGAVRYESNGGTTFFETLLLTRIPGGALAVRTIILCKDCVKKTDEYLVVTLDRKAVGL